MASSTIPSRGTAPGRARCGAANRARCLHPHEPARSSYTDRSQCADASPVAGSPRNRRTSGCAEGPSPSQDQDSRRRPDVSRAVDRLATDRFTATQLEHAVQSPLFVRCRRRRQRHRQIGKPQWRTTGAIRTPRILDASRRVCPESSPAIASFSQELAECGGLKNRRLAECKIWIDQVSISVTLSVCGEVAERLKAAVC